ncbi:MAG TPA: 16S rRNA (cytosine(1402)-N(4))-methyltransferase RsmH [Vicinamibacterales bacterium]|nr:16S rRNA (cytosine(1402)-N(4))-methyltransferase RsmH [Vicinamibacterales bacterium]
MADERTHHVPVMVGEVGALLEPARGGVFVDGTVGLGGHARMLLDDGADRLIGLDRDPDALQAARAALHRFGDRVTLVHADYRALGAVLDAQRVDVVDGIVLDLGVSSLQLDAGGRGFSFRRDEPLDMRMDQSQGATAAERLAAVDESELADVIYRFGEERKSRRVARAIVRAREDAPIERTGQLAAIVRRAVGGPWQRIDPATRTFQALRIWVNGELDGLDAALDGAVSRLRAAAGPGGGRLAVISFHSLEDRVVKHAFRGMAFGDRPRVRLLTKRPIVAGAGEVAANPRARSAKLRGVERLAA